MTGTYLYAITPTRGEATLDVMGVDDREKVRAVVCCRLAAVVGPAPLDDYHGLRREQLIRYLLAHQRVVDAVMRDHQVLPVKFGTVLTDIERVRRMLAQGQELLSDTMAQFASLAQMEVVVLWDQQQVFEAIGLEDPIAGLKTEIAGRPPEEATSQRIELGRAVQAELERRRAALQERILPRLGELALDVVVNPLMDDSMVANAALLIEGTRREALDKLLEAMDGEAAGSLTFRCVGPLPPYSFATVEVDCPTFEAVDEARCRLGLGDAATLGEIKRAYRALAGEFHPDANPGGDEAVGRMSELAEAYKLISAYARSRGLAGQQAEAAVCHFDHSAVKDTFMIEVRRQESAVG